MRPVRPGNDPSRRDDRRRSSPPPGERGGRPPRQDRPPFDEPLIDADWRDDRSVAGRDAAGRDADAPYRPDRTGGRRSGARSAPERRYRDDEYDDPPYADGRSGEPSSSPSGPGDRHFGAHYPENPYVNDRYAGDRPERSRRDGDEEPGRRPAPERDRSDRAPWDAERSRVPSRSTYRDDGQRVRREIPGYGRRPADPYADPYTPRPEDDVDAVGRAVYGYRPEPSPDDVRRDRDRTSADREDGRAPRRGPRRPAEGTPRRDLAWPDEIDDRDNQRQAGAGHLRTDPYGDGYDEPGIDRDWPADDSPDPSGRTAGDDSPLTGSAGDFADVESANAPASDPGGDVRPRFAGRTTGGRTTGRRPSGGGPRRSLTALLDRLRPESRRSVPASAAWDDTWDDDLALSAGPDPESGSPWNDAAADGPMPRRRERRASEPVDRDPIAGDLRDDLEAPYAPEPDWSASDSTQDERWRDPVDAVGDRSAAHDDWPGETGNGAEPAPDALPTRTGDRAAEVIAPDPGESWETPHAGDEDRADDEAWAADEPRADLFSASVPVSWRRTSGADGVRPPVWGLSGYSWRFARHLTIARTNRLLRFGAARVLPASSRARFLAMGLPEAEVDETLAQIRSLDDWAEAWTGLAQRFLGEARRSGELTPADAAWARQLAALCYHAASFFAFGDDRLGRTSRSASVTLFGQSLGQVMPETRSVNVRWRSKTMPGYLTVPSWAEGRRPLAVLLNGVTTSREELILWSDEFLAQGVAVLALDTPGLGEGIALGPVGLDDDDLLDGVFELADSDPGLDPTKVSVVGVSLGGTLALRLAAAERRVSAVVAVTPTYEPARWLGASSPVVLAQMVPAFGSYEQLADFSLNLRLDDSLAALGAQALIFGAGRDLVVPPPEASRLAAVLGEQATLVWFDDAGHALFDVIPEWTREAAEWLAVVMDVADAPVFADEDEISGEATSSAATPPADDATSAADGTDDTAWSAPTDTSTAPEATSAGGQPDADGGERRVPVPTRRPSSTSHIPAPAPAPEPYGDGVLTAEEAAERRARGTDTGTAGYETGAFGPLGPAAARILAGDPTPDEIAAERDYADQPWPDPAERPERRDPTSRLWESGNRSVSRVRRPADDWPPTDPAASGLYADPPSRPAAPASPERPVMTDRAAAGRPASLREPAAGEPARRIDQTDRLIMEAGTDGPGPSLTTTPAPRAPRPGDYLAPTAPVVGRGRTSEPFATVPLNGATPAPAPVPAPWTSPVPNPTTAATAPAGADASRLGLYDPAAASIPTPAGPDADEPGPPTDTGRSTPTTPSVGNSSVIPESGDHSGTDIRPADPPDDEDDPVPVDRAGPEAATGPPVDERSADDDLRTRRANPD